MEGVVVSNSPSIEKMRVLRDADIEMLDAGVRRLMNPHIYHVSLTEKLWNLKKKMTEKIKQ